MIKRILGILVVVFLLGMLILSGCTAQTSTSALDKGVEAAKQQQEGVKAMESDAAAAETTAAPETTAAAEKANIYMSHWRQEESDAWKTIITDFQAANPDITVSLEILPEDQFYTTLAARLISGEGLDVALINPGSRFNTALKSDPYVDLKPLLDLSEIGESYISAGTFDGKLLMLPTTKLFAGFFYNKTVFEEAGLDPENPPKTWDDFLAACAAIKAIGKEAIATGMAERYTSTWPWIDLLELYSRDQNYYLKLWDGTMNIDDPLTRKILEPVRELADKGYWMKGADGTKNDQALAFFAGGNAGFYNGGSWAIGAIQTANPDCKFGMMLMPGPGVDEPIAGIYPGEGLWIYKNTTNLDASVKFCQYLISKDVMEAYGNKTGKVTCNKLAVSNNADLAAAIAVGNSGQVYPHVFSPNSIMDQDIVGTMITQAILGVMPIDDIIAEAQQQLEAARPSK